MRQPSLLSIIVVGSLVTGMLTPSTALASPASPVVTVIAPNPLAGFTAVACTSVGNCVAGGESFSPSTPGHPSRYFPIVATEINGSWAPAVSVASPTATSTSTSTNASTVTSIACPAVSQCVVVVERVTLSATRGTAGSYSSYVVAQTSTGWSTPLRVPLSGTGQRNARVIAIQCPEIASCTLLGTSQDSLTSDVLFTMTWSAEGFSPVHVISLSPLGSAVREAAGLSMSCPALGSCVVVGQYDELTSPIRYEPFTLAEVAGHWQSIRRRAAYGGASHNNTLDSVSCTSPGNCLAVGASVGRATTTNYGALLIRETAGVWGTARLLPRSPSHLTFKAVSCVSIGNCTALLTPGLGAAYGNSASEATETHGKWSAPSTAPLSGYTMANLVAVTCVSPLTCVAVGQAIPRTTLGQVPIVASSTSGVWQ